MIYLSLSGSHKKQEFLDDHKGTRWGHFSFAKLGKFPPLSYLSKFPRTNQPRVLLLSSERVHCIIMVSLMYFIQLFYA